MNSKERRKEAAINTTAATVVYAVGGGIIGFLGGGPIGAYLGASTMAALGFGKSMKDNQKNQDKYS